MISRAAPDFWDAYRNLPRPIQRLAIKNYRLWQTNPHHLSLHFKKVGLRVWSARVGIGHRAVAAPIPGGFVWY